VTPRGCPTPLDAALVVQNRRMFERMTMIVRLLQLAISALAEADSDLEAIVLQATNQFVCGNRKV